MSLCQCFHPFSWPPSIWGSKKPLKLPSPAHRSPCPVSILASIRISLCTMVWTLIQTQFAKISSIFTLAISFLVASEPFISPQNCYASLWACLAKALAPTDNRDSLAPFAFSSSVRTVCYALKLAYSYGMFGHGISWEATDFRKPSIVIIPLGFKCMTRSLTAAC